MSYPAPKYDGSAGETSTSLRRHDHPAELPSPGGNTVHYLATTASTGGEFGLYRWEFGPQPSGPDPHFHRTISESFYILSGTVALFDGRAWVEAGAGDFLYVPQGGIHGFRNEAGEASMLLLFTPGAPREDYFETLVDVAAKRRDLSPEERQEFYLRHDTYWL